MAKVGRLANEALDAVTMEDWKKCTDHYNKIQEDYLIKERIQNEKTQFHNNIFTFILLNTYFSNYVTIFSTQ